MKSFENITGNKSVIKFLKNSIKLQKISHAYIITGYEGCGKTLIAETFAKTILCENNESTDACCICKSCKTFESKNNPDVFYINNKNKSIGINEIKEQLIQKVMIKPYIYEYKIFIIENADEMTNEAQNSFLKTLEEPPKYAIFLLLSKNINKLINTIKSRCIIIKINLLSSHEIKNYMIKNTNIPIEKISLIAEYSEGSIGKALKISNSKEFINMREEITNILINLSQKNDLYIFESINTIEKYKNEKYMIDIILLWYRDILCLKILKNEKYIIQKDKKNIILKESYKYSIENLIKKCEYCILTKNQILKNGNFRLCMEILFMNLKE